MIKIFTRKLLFFILICISIQFSFAQEDSVDVQAAPFPDSLRPDPAWVIVQSDTLFPLYAHIGPFHPEERAEGIVNRLKKIGKYPKLRIDSLEVIPGIGYDDITYGEIHIMTVTDNDALYEGVTREELTAERLLLFETAIEVTNEERDLNYWLIHTGSFLLSLVGLILLLYLVKRIFRWLMKKVDYYTTKWSLHDRKFFKFLSYFSRKEGQSVLHILVRLIRIILILIILFFYLPFVFAFLPWTENLARKFFDYIADPIRFLINGFLDFLPDLIFIIVIIIVTRYLVRTLKNIAMEIKTGKFKIKGFYPDWAGPTFNLARVIIWVFAIIIIFPHIPGSDSPAFQGLSIFLGVLFSLGSTSAIANIVAGIVITYMRPFQKGDRVKINDAIGDVVEKNLLVTKIKTIKNVDVSIPNATILGTHLWNFTKNAKELGIILHSAVTIGYDVSSQLVRKLLVDAALATELTEKDPHPFVLQSSLDDFYVSYEINVYTKHPDKMAEIYSDLHEHILKSFNEAGVEILSPHYSAMRDGHDPGIPSENIPEDHKSKGFKFENPLEKIIKPHK